MSTTAQALPQRHRYTATEYHRMAAAGIFGEDDRVELIQGEIIDMAPTGSLHAGTVKYLVAALMRVIGERAMLSVQDPVALNGYSEPQPDLALLRPRPDFYKQGHPNAADVLLVIEVAESSVTYDREVKLPLYAAHGIPETWLVDLQADRLDIHREPSAGGYRATDCPADLATVHLPQPLGGRIDLSGLFQR